MNIHNINIDDKFVVVKKMWFLDEGIVATVTNVDEDDIVSFTFGENNANKGYMDFASFKEHFEKVEDTEEEAPRITEEYIAEIIDNSEFEINTVFDKCTVVSCRLPNGFVIVESSACVSKDDYNEEYGTEICLNKITNKIWELEAYRLQQALYEGNVECPCECDNCDECPYDESPCN